MARRVAVVGYAQSRHQQDVQMTREDMVFEVAKGALYSAGISREDVGTVITASTDFLDARTISNLYTSMAVGAFAAYYALMRILSEVHDIALVEAHTQGSVVLLNLGRS